MSGGYWNTWLNNSRAIVDYNTLFREFHQACAMTDFVGVKKVCEPRLANHVMESLKRIRFHGLYVEMANLTIEQPSFKIIKAEVNQGLNVDRARNLNLKDYNVTQNYNIFGAKWTTYAPKDRDTRHVLDVLDNDVHKPFLVSLTCLIESPMKLYVLNQNHSSVLFGSDDEESVKNVVKFEANLHWYDFFNLSPVDNKKSLGEWKITDFNNVMNENLHFDEQQ